MKNPTLSFYNSLSSTGFHQLAFHHYPYTGDEKKDDKMTVICVHGLTRNKGDFKNIAFCLQNISDVYCLDIVGRGESDHLSNYQLYDYPQYVTDLSHFFAHINRRNIHWIGTSMGGILGMILASLPNTPIKSLTINDVGYFIPAQSLQKIAEYVGNTSEFESFQQGKDYLKRIHHEFAPMSEEDWYDMASNSLFENENGAVQLSYDPQIGTKLRELDLSQDVDLSAIWQNIICPTLVIRGENSKLFPQNIADNMVKDKANVDMIEINGAGHAPSLNGTYEQTKIFDWLKRFA